MTFKNQTVAFKRMVQMLVEGTKFTAHILMVLRSLHKLSKQSSEVQHTNGHRGPQSNVFTRPWDSWWVSGFEVRCLEFMTRRADCGPASLPLCTQVKGGADTTCVDNNFVLKARNQTSEVSQPLSITFCFLSMEWKSRFQHKLRNDWRVNSALKMNRIKY